VTRVAHIVGCAPVRVPQGGTPVPKSPVRVADDVDPGVVKVGEHLVDVEASQAHRKSPYFRSYVEGTIAPLLSERQWDRYDEVEPGWELPGRQTGR